MSARNGAGVTHQSDADAREIDQLGGRVSFVATPECKPFQVSAPNSSGDSCSALGIHVDAKVTLPVGVAGAEEVLNVLHALEKRGWLTKVRSHDH
jgi:hypothetical protein